MKTYFISALLMLISVLSFGQSRYKYVIVPTQFPEIASGFNPYGISSAVQGILKEKSISTVFESDDRPADYCEALTMDIEKMQSMLRNKLRVSLLDCQHRVVWSSEGTGMSKDYREGYAEALADAMKDLTELPENKTPKYQTTVAVAVPVQETPKAEPAPAPKIEEPEVAEPVSGAVVSVQDEIYVPGNLYYNYSYFVDLVEGGQGQKKLVVINGEQLGYSNLQAIAVLSPSGLGDVYTVQWTNADGSKISGVANLSSGKLSISLQTGETPRVITLKAYK